MLGSVSTSSTLAIRVITFVIQNSKISYYKKYMNKIHKLTTLINGIIESYIQWKSFPLDMHALTNFQFYRKSIPKSCSTHRAFYKPLAGHSGTFKQYSYTLFP